MKKSQTELYLAEDFGTVKNESRREQKTKIKRIHSGLFLTQQWHFKMLISVDREGISSNCVIAKQYGTCFFCAHQEGELIDLPSNPCSYMPLCLTMTGSNKTLFSFGLCCSSVDFKAKVLSPDSFLVSSISPLPF